MELEAHEANLLRLLEHRMDDARRIGQLEQANENLAAWRPEQEADPQDLMWYRHVRALIGFSKGEVLESSASLERVQEERERLGYGLDLLWGRLDLGAGLTRAEPARAAGGSVPKSRRSG